MGGSWRVVVESSYRILENRILDSGFWILDSWIFDY